MLQVSQVTTATVAKPTANIIEWRRRGRRQREILLVARQIADYSHAEHPLEQAASRHKRAVLIFTAFRHYSR